MVERTRLSSKGQVVLPGRIRAARRWSAGMEFVVVETDEGVLLKPANPFPPTRMDDVFGKARYDGPPLTLAQMDEAIRREAARRR